MTYQTYVCEHGNSGSCPHDTLFQFRFAWKIGVDPRGPEDEWQTHTVSACDRDPQATQRQVGPVLRRRNYETRTVRVGDLKS